MYKKITAPQLRKIRYTPHQYELWDICNSMREEGATFPAIAKYLDENGYKSARGKLFKNPHIHTRLKKRRMPKDFDRVISCENVYVGERIRDMFYDKDGKSIYLAP